MDLHGSGNLYRFKFGFNSSELFERLIEHGFDMTDRIMAGLARWRTCTEIKGTYTAPSSPNETAAASFTLPP
jgi:hypothetical protein